MVWGLSLFKVVMLEGYNVVCVEVGVVLLMWSDVLVDSVCVYVEMMVKMYWFEYVL